MENLTNQILKLKSGKNYFVLRQAAYKGITYYFGAEVTSDAEGKAVAVTGSEKVNGYALDESTTSGEIIRIVRGI